MLITENLIKGKLPPREITSHKGDFGKVSVVAGSTYYIGAATLSTTATLKVGAGLVTLCSTEKVCTTVATYNPTSTFLPLKDTDGVISKLTINKILDTTPDVFVVGCGLSKTTDTISLVKNIISGAKSPIVLDADGLNAIANDLDVLRCKKSDIVITPHLGEMSRLCKKTISEISDNRESVAKDFAKEHNVTVVLKGHNTIIATPKGDVFENTTGNAGMAKGGSGDILAGMIGGFVAQGLSITDATITAVYLHGLAGDFAKEEFTEYSMLPTDTLNMISEAIKTVI